jgi:glycosyltransferase involved in cell wall biosynthesis
MLRIGIVCHEFPPIGGGGGQAVYDLANNLMKKGHSLHVITSQFNGLMEYEFKDGIHVRRIFSFRSEKYPGILQSTRAVSSMLALYSFFPSSLFYIIKSQKLDVVHGFFLIPSGLPAVIAAKLCDIPSVVTAAGADIHDPTRYRRSRTFLRMILRWIIKEADIVTAVSNDMKVRTYNLSQREDIKVLPLGINIESLPIMNHETSDKYVAITVCRLVRRKRFDDAKLLIVGDGPQREDLQKMSSSLGLTENVEFLGYLPKQKLIELYGKATVYVSSSYHEAFYLGGIEAMTYGLPVVAPDVGGIPDWLLHGQTGFLYEFGNEEMLAYHIEKIFKDNEMRNRFAIRSRERSIEFDWGKIVERYIQLYEQLVG